MQDILNKYYEFFIKSNFTTRDTTKDDKEFYELYKLITNRYDLSKDRNLNYDLMVFFDFFDSVDNFEIRRHAMYSYTQDNVERRKSNFERRERVSFGWFNASPNMVKNDDFIYSIKRTNDIFCKVYLSIKSEKYIEVMIELQKFIDNLYKNHPNEELGQCKFRNVPSNDAIVMRFASKKHYEEFLNFLDENPKIKNSFDTPNLFIPRDEYGLSVLPDQNSSYNFFVTKMLWDYMFECKEKSINASVEGLCNFIANYNCLTPEIMDKCNESVIGSFKDILIGKLTSKPDSELLSFMNKKSKKLELGIITLNLSNLKGKDGTPLYKNIFKTSKAT